MKHYVYPLAILFGFGMVFAQDTITVSKSALLEKVNANLQLKIAEQQVALANADYNQSKALFLPSISASHTAITTTNPLMAFGSKLNQERLTAADFNPALLNDPNQIQNFATRIEVLQPIINVDGFYQRKAAKIQRDAFALQKERTAQYLQMEVEKLRGEIASLMQAAVQFSSDAMQSTEVIRKFLHERVGTNPEQVVNEALLADLGVDSADTLKTTHYEAPTKRGKGVMVKDAAELVAALKAKGLL